MAAVIVPRGGAVRSGVAIWSGLGAKCVKVNLLFFEARPRHKDPWTEALWVYDLRTNKRFTLKERSLRYTDMEEFVGLAKLSNRCARTETDRFKRFCWTISGTAPVATDAAPRPQRDDARASSAIFRNLSSAVRNCARHHARQSR